MERLTHARRVPMMHPMDTTITILERKCAYEDYDTESGRGMPDNVEPYEVDVITLDDDTADGVQLDGRIASVLEDYGVGQWDGGNTAYDPDGSHMAPNGAITERWARVDRAPSDPWANDPDRTTRREAPQSTEDIVAAVRAVAERTPNPCEGSHGHLRDDFAWQAEQDLRDLRGGASLDFTEADLRDDCVAALARWAEQDGS